MRISSKINLLLLTIIVISSISCKRSGKRTTEVSPGSLESKLTVLHDSLHHAWEVMIRDDDEKIQFMQRLLDEVSYAGHHDASRKEELLSMTEELKAMRYDRLTMKNSRLIDQYDSATNEVTRQVVSFAYDSPEYENNELMKRLVKEIADKNGMVIIYRVHYDAFAEEINEILTRHGGEIDTSGTGWQVWPLFRLPPEDI